MERASLEKHADLLGILERLRSRVSGRREIWYQMGLSYESGVELRPGLVQGGAMSPQYLRRQDRVTGRPSYWTFHAVNARVLVAEPIGTRFEEWVEFLEPFAQAEESLCLVTPGIEVDDFLRGCIVNTMRGSISICVVSPLLEEDEEDLLRLARQVSELSGSGPQSGQLPYIRADEVPPAALREKLPLAEEILVRRNHSVLFPKAEVTESEALSEVAIIHVGGHSYDHQVERLEALVRHLTADLSGR